MFNITSIYKMKQILLLFLALIALTYANAQAPAIQWSKTYGGIGFEEAESILQTTDGGFIIAGHTNLNSGDVTDNHATNTDDFWVVKTSATGAIQWKKCYGGTADDKAYSILQTADGNYIVAGSSVSTNGDVTGVHINPYNALWGDYWIIKIDSSGTLLWQKTIGGTSLDVARKIIQTSDGGFIVVGEGYAQNAWDGDFTYGDNIVKLSSTGDIQWVTYGGTYNYDIKQTPDGGYIAVGFLGGKFGITKFNSLGTIEWQKIYGSSSYYDFAYGVELTDDGGYIVAGDVTGSDGDVTGYHGGTADAWVIKLNNTGDLLWQKTLGGSYYDKANCLLKTADGGYIIAGETNSNDGDVSGLHGIAGDTGGAGAPNTDYWVVKLNSNGAVQWQKTMGGHYIDKASCIIKTNDGGYAVGGYVALQMVNSGDVTGFHLNTQIPNASGFDYWLVKLAPENLSVTNTNTNAIALYPNPTTDLIHLSGLAPEACDIKICNELGNTVASYTNTTNRTFDISNLSTGVYFLSVANNYFKIIKK